MCSLKGKKLKIRVCLMCDVLPSFNSILFLELSRITLSDIPHQQFYGSSTADLRVAKETSANIFVRAYIMSVGVKMKIVARS